MWIVDHPGPNGTGIERQAFDNETDAATAKLKLDARAVKGAVMWFCAGVDVGHESDETGAVAAVPLVEKVLGHLGMRTATTGEMG